MQANQTSNNQKRIERLRALLGHERNSALLRVRELRRDQEQEALPPPADEMDAARSLADIETHASLIERAEERLKAIDFAFNRLEQSHYGICAQCGDEIPVERLAALPFAAYCLECQKKRNHEMRSAKPWIDEPFVHLWDMPEGMEESTEKSRDEAVSVGREEGPIRRARERRPRAMRPGLLPKAGSKGAGKAKRK